MISQFSIILVFPDSFRNFTTQMQHKCNTDYFMAKYIPYIKKSYVSQEGTTPVYIRYNYDRTRRTMIATGYRIKPDHWDEKRSQVRKSCPKFEEIDAKLKKMTAQLGNILTFC